MTDLGRGSGSQPWHPEDPLYGDGGGWGQQAHSGTYDPYAGGAQQQYPDQYSQQQYGGQQPQHSQEQYQQHSQGQYQQGQYPQDPYGGQQYQDPQQHPDPYSQQPQQPQHPQQPQQWDTSAGQYGHQQPQDPYGQQPEPYHGQGSYEDPAARGAQGGHHGDAPHPGHGQGGQYQDHPQQGSPQYRQDDGQEPAPAPASQEPGGLPAEDEPEEETHAFFADDPDEDRPRGRGEDRRGRSRSRSRGRGKDTERRGGAKRRSGMACLVVVAVLGGGIGVVGYVAKQYWDSNYAAAPDYEGEGKGEIQIEIPSGAGSDRIAQILKDAGVVKSTGAYINVAYANSKKAEGIQAGFFVLRKQMSAQAAFDMLTDPASQNVLIVPEGWRNAQVYEAVDKKLEVKAGTTAEVAEEKVDKLGLPDWASDDPGLKDPLEGFLFPSRYSIGDKSTPESVLKQMVAEANKQYERLDLADSAEKVGLDSPYELLTVASLVQAEGRTHDDFRKMARVVYNRLEPGQTETNGKLEFDSTYNYLKGQSELHLPLSEMRRLDHPYNTHFVVGLPPGPIDNPGAEAVAAAISPEKGDWYYFISLDGKETIFSETYEEHQRLADEFKRQQDEKSAQQ
ncbi:endolytic transglycosylase MltG [Streptomyces sp. NPDC059506]|uniref:endolytic transglycosylase MltG n=1 Tax=Streptomyces sp. NPDC059506 TaxID=3347751 RepID=UPI0036BB60A7